MNTEIINMRTGKLMERLTHPYNRRYLRYSPEGIFLTTGIILGYTPELAKKVRLVTNRKLTVMMVQELTDAVIYNIPNPTQPNDLILVDSFFWMSPQQKEFLERRGYLVYEY